MTECGLTNLATCLPEKFFEYLSGMLTAPVQPLLNLARDLLSQPVNLTLFQPLWSLIVYLISVFYGLFFLFAGFNLMISGYDSAKRDQAKSWLRNIVLMVLLVQSSYLMYGLLLELSNLLTAGIINFIDPNFFLMKTDNFTNFSLQLVLLIPQLFFILMTVLLLGLRYLMVALGIVLFPLAIFCYFIPPLHSYGKLILSSLVTVIFITFFDALFLLGASLLLSQPPFDSFKIVLTTVSFLSLDLIMIGTLLFVLIKAASSVLETSLGKEFKGVFQHLF